MILGYVEGTVVASQKDPGLEGFKLLLVRHANADLTPGKSISVAVDAIGAGEGELVLVVTGSSARLAQRALNKPVDSTIIAIVDHVTIGSSAAYRKQGPVAAAAK